MGKLKARKATFTVETVKGERVFTAVNKRAHIVLKKLGKRTKASASLLKQAVGMGSYKLYQYGADGTLKAIRF